MHYGKGCKWCHAIQQRAQELEQDEADQAVAPAAAEKEPIVRRAAVADAEEALEPRLIFQRRMAVNRDDDSVSQRPSHLESSLVAQRRVAPKDKLYDFNALRHKLPVVRAQTQESVFSLPCVLSICPALKLLLYGMEVQSFRL